MCAIATLRINPGASARAGLPDPRARSHRLKPLAQTPVRAISLKTKRASVMTQTLL
jgi:hypothetical protein